MKAFWRPVNLDADDLKQWEKIVIQVQQETVLSSKIDYLI